ncbi:hypothetical protein [Streptomyces sp. Tu 3180]|uniref:hypothetical protein n=1 Tax=Streptomyces sp. Tu 3180 TaxID=2682611 RepID=UPI0013596ED1|nr:hypothetical protein [Streptomyces sp. Tu 3180]KAF3463624.1 hypothetical protein GL259_04400 [Streptomyces sp. Tu 3180]
MSNWPGTPQSAARAAVPRSVIITLIALPSPSGSRSSRHMTVRVRRFGFSFWGAPFFFAASRTATRA